MAILPTDRRRREGHEYSKLDPYQAFGAWITQEPLSYFVGKPGMGNSVPVLETKISVSDHTYDIVDQEEQQRQQQFQQHNNFNSFTNGSTRRSLTMIHNDGGGGGYWGV